MSNTRHLGFKNMEEDVFDEDVWGILVDETGFYGGQIDEYESENNPSDDIAWSSLATTPFSDNSSATHAKDTDSNDVQHSENVARVEQLRSKFSQLISRKNIVMDMLIELFEKDMVRLT